MISNSNIFFPIKKVANFKAWMIQVSAGHDLVQKIDENKYFGLKFTKILKPKW